MSQDFKLVDSHCHLDMLLDHDLIDNIVERADKAGVKYLQTICTKLEEFPKILALAEKYEHVFASVGMHPSDVKDPVLTEKLIELTKHKKVIGLGETGLDYFYNKDKKQRHQQIDAFTAHIDASCETDIPVIIHTRDAEEDTHHMIKQAKKGKNFPGLIHCFTSSKEFASKMLDLDMYISISGIVTFKNAEELKEVVKFVPLSRLLVETDSPYLAPVPNRGKTNEPAYTYYVAEYIAELKGISLEEVAEQTTDNFFNLFTKAIR